MPFSKGEERETETERRRGTGSEKGTERRKETEEKKDQDMRGKGVVRQYFSLVYFASLFIFTSFVA